MKGIEFRLDNIGAVLARRGLESGGRVQRYIDGEVLRLSGPYVPRLTGALEKSGALPGSGGVIWSAPYARRRYYGRAMAGAGGGMRGAFWFERMKADHGDGIARGAARMAGGSAKRALLRA